MLALPVLFRWPLVLCPLYATIVVLGLIVLLLERRAAGRDVDEQLRKELAQRGWLSRGGHR